MPDIQTSVTSAFLCLLLYNFQSFPLVVKASNALFFFLRILAYFGIIPSLALIVALLKKQRYNDPICRIFDDFFDIIAIRKYFYATVGYRCDR